MGETRIRVLGPFELSHDGKATPVGGPVVQAIVTALACRPNTKVLPAQLISMVWGHSGAVSTDTLYHHVTGLRRALAPVGLEVVGHRPGYRLPVGVGQVDVARFDELVRVARALADTDPDQAAGRLREALELWRGPHAIDNITLAGIRRLAAGWEARRLDAEEDLVEIDLRIGRPDQVLDRLHSLTAAHPDRPRLVAALARALHATGRTDQARIVLADAEHLPGRVAGTAHPAVVQAQRALSAPGRPDPVGWIPFQLPADTVRFTGRAGQLERLLELRPDTAGSTAAAVTAVTGMAGIGKTALVVHAAHHLAGRFPDGVLFTDLRGFAPEAEPLPPDRVLDHLLRGLGVPGQQIPHDLDARVGLYRSALAGRRVLIVLDNAIDEAQVIPLLPSSPGCRVIVTSRRHLTGLDEAAHVTLPVLDHSEASDLFRAVAGDRTQLTDQDTIDRIVALCGRLPLAIRIVGARLRQTTAGTPAQLCAELAAALGTGSGLDWLSDGHRAVTTALAVSYQHLATDQQRAICLIGLHPGASIEPHALAALADSTVDHARQLLDQVHSASLLDQPAYRRYTVHDLVAAYATTLAADLPEADRHAALDRLYDHYAATTSQALNLTEPWAADQRPSPPVTTSAHRLSDPEQARDWLGTEIDNLLAAAHHAAGRRADHTLHQSATLHRYLRTSERYGDALLLHRHALENARRAGRHHAEQDALVALGIVHRLQARYGPAAECLERALAGAQQTGNPFAAQDALVGLGQIHRLQGRYGSATGCLAQALAGARQTGNRYAEQYALVELGHCHWLQGRYESATDCFEQALIGARHTGNRHAEQYVLIGLGQVRYLLGRYSAAAECFEQALASARRTGNRHGEEEALRGLGQVLYLLGRYEGAADCFEQALASARRTGYHYSEQEALRGLGQVHLAQGRYEPAVECLGRALDTAREIADRNAQFEAHQGLGRAQHAAGSHHDALQHHERALQLATDLDQPADQARAHDGLANTHHALNRPREARHHWQGALDLLAGIGAEHTEEPGVTTVDIRDRLCHLDSR